LLGNGSINKFPRQRIRRQQQRNCWERCFLFCPCPASRRRRRKGYNWATLFLGDINTGTWPHRLGESRTWDSKNLRMTALASASSNCNRQTHPLVKRGYYIRTMMVSVQLIKKSPVVSRGLSPRRTDWR
jgi:hypothetical protein